MQCMPADSQKRRHLKPTSGKSGVQKWPLGSISKNYQNGKVSWSWWILGGAVKQRGCEQWWQARHVCTAGFFPVICGVNRGRGICIFFVSFVCWKLPIFLWGKGKTVAHFSAFRHAKIFLFCLRRWIYQNRIRLLPESMWGW